MSTKRARRIRPRREPFEIADVKVEAGHSIDLDVFGARLPAGGDLTIPLRVLHGRREGPVVFISAAIHGDELNGVEVARRLLAEIRPERLGGTLLVDNTTALGWVLPVALNGFQVRVPLPLDPALFRATFHAQVLQLDAGLPQGVAMSQGLRIFIRG